MKMADNKLPKGLKVMFMNTRSINGKLSDIIESVGDIDIFGANETWLNESMQDGEVHWEGMSIYRNDRNTDKAGGVLIYVKNTLANHVTIDAEGTQLNPDIEMLTTNIEKPKVRKKKIISIYRPPKGNIPKFVQVLDDYLDNVDLTSYDVWLGGSVSDLGSGQLTQFLLS